MPIEAQPPTTPAVSELHGFWLVCCREYLQRIRSVSFLASTLAVPVLFTALAVTPMLLHNPTIAAVRPIVVACEEPDLARNLEASLLHYPGRRYQVETVAQAPLEHRDALLRMVDEARIAGFVWVNENALRSGIITLTSDFPLSAVQRENLRAAISWAFIRARMVRQGLTAEQIGRVLQPVRFNSVVLTETREQGGDAALIVTGIIITALEVSLLSYGMVVMRSVLEDKTSRVAEILLCSVTPRALMAGKILGIGAVSLSQVLLWMMLLVVAFAFSGPALHAEIAVFQLSSSSLAVFAMLYALGYLFYSVLYAAVGAAFNSIDEAQYWNLLLTLPLLFSGIAVWSLFARPDSAISVALSLVPLSAPLLMSMRVALGTASSWQIALSLVLMAAAVYGAMIFAARVYRVGLLMYGKKPTLREISRWLFSPT